MGMLAWVDCTCWGSRGHAQHLQLKKAGDKDIDDIRTLMEEVDMRIAECKKDTYEFKRDIIIGAENPRTGKIVAEKMIRCVMFRVKWFLGSLGANLIRKGLHSGNVQAASVGSCIGHPLYLPTLTYAHRFMEEKLRQKDTVIEKLRLKNSTTKAQIAKMEQQLAHKEEMGEVLHLVDFDQLKIENQQYMEKIEERNNELLRLKLSTSRTVQVSQG